MEKMLQERSSTLAQARVGDIFKARVLALKVGLDSGVCSPSTVLQVITWMIIQTTGHLTSTTLPPAALFSFF